MFLYVIYCPATGRLDVISIPNRGFNRTLSCDGIATLKALSPENANQYIVLASKDMLGFGDVSINCKEALVVDILPRD
jgi:hypothetical protein